MYTATKKDFELITSVLRASKASPAIVQAFADRLKRENERFNVATFRRAATAEEVGPAPLTADMVDWQLECLPEDMPIRGNASAWGEPDDSEYAERIENELADGNQWAWCQVRLVGRYKGLTASDSLGGCSYASEGDFKQPGGYYDDMRANVLSDLQSQLDDIRRT